ANIFGKISGGPQVSYQPDGSIEVNYDNAGQTITGTALFTLGLEGLATGQPLDAVTLVNVSLTGLGQIPIAGDGLVLLSGCDVGKDFGFGKRVRITSVQPNP